MKRIVVIVCILIALSLSFISCSKQSNYELSKEEWSSSVGENSRTTYEEFVEKMAEKGVDEIMLKTLGNLGYTQEEMLSLTSEHIAQIFAPGEVMDGAPGFNPDENQVKELNAVGIDVGMSVILFNLGYEYDEMIRLSPKEIDFIFPNTELKANLIEKGFKEKEVQTWAVRESGKTYKDLIKEALKK